MFSNPLDAQNLHSSIAYKSYSDAKLSALYFDNANNFPIAMLIKVFDMILDPLFSLEEISFKSFWDIFDYVAEYRRRNLSIPSRLREISAPPVPETEQTASHSPVALSLVVDRMLERRLPLGAAAIGSDWRDAYVANMANFHAMSLVHPSWTPNAREGLRLRAVIPSYQINNFLRSPLCGPWITEMIVYWIVDRAHESITESDVLLFKALLERTPGVRSLALHTIISKPRKNSNAPEYNYLEGKGLAKLERTLHLDACLSLVSELLPNLECLWLKHSKVATGGFQFCPYLSSLRHHLPKMRALKFLSIRSWDAEGAVDWSTHPCPNLKTLELDNVKRFGGETLRWLLSPRKGFILRSLSIAIREDSMLGGDILCHLPKLEELRLHLSSSDRNVLGLCHNILSRCGQLTSLSLFTEGDVAANRLMFPRTLEHLALQYSDEQLDELLDPSPGSRTSSKFIHDIKTRLRALPRLRSLVLTGVPQFPRDDAVHRDVDGFIHYMSLPITEIKTGIPDVLDAMCKEHGVQLIRRSDWLATLYNSTTTATKTGLLQKIRTYAVSHSGHGT